MKNDSQTQETQDINLAKCSKGNQATIVCSSQHCDHRAFICGDKKCDCRLCHKFCFYLDIQRLMDVILANSFSLQPLLQKIEAFFDEAIDKLSEQRDNIILQIKSQDKFQYLGLSELEKKFVDVVKQGAKDHQINCMLVWNIQNQFKAEKRVNQTLNQAEMFIQKMKQNLKKQSKDYSSDLRNFLQKISRQQSLQHVFTNSKVTKGSQDQDKLLAFFTQNKVESAKMLYRASQNDFLTTKWYEKCGNVPNTLTIVETEFGKVIGGFTTFKWVRNDQYQSAVNDEKNHFLFSLTNNDKLTITKNAQYSIVGYTSDFYGPSFGYGNDLRICSNANKNNSSYANIGNTYTNPKYTYEDTNSHINFAGAHNFKIKQWEVWEIKFVQ